MISMLLFTILAGIFYALFFVESKKRSLINPQPIIDVFVTLLRLIVLIFIIFKIVQNCPSNSIHLLILFVSSYLSTIALLVFKQKN